MSRTSAAPGRLRLAMSRTSSREFQKTERLHQIHLSHGFAIRELIIVSAMAAATVMVCVAIKRAAEKPRLGFNVPTGIVDRVEVFPAIEISLGDDFMAVVGLDTFSRPDSAGPTSFYSHLRIARKCAHDVHPFLFSIDAGEHSAWDAASCRFWELVPSDDVEEEDYSAISGIMDFSYAGRTERSEFRQSAGVIGTASQSAHRTNRVRFLVDRDNPRRDILHVMDLEPALQALLPADLLPSHDILRICKDFNSFQLPDMHDFPFLGLAAAIRTASTENEWTTTDPQVLLQQRSDQEKPFNDAERTAFAQSLLWRLYTMLPLEDQTTVE